MNLINVSKVKDAPKILWQLMEERDDSVNISHRRMPTPEGHLAFIKNHPYQCWYIIEADGDKVGSIYITKQREIGIFVLKAHQRKGYAKQAIAMIMKKWPGHFLANINPANLGSIGLFNDFGFTLIQHTYRKDPCT